MDESVYIWKNKTIHLLIIWLLIIPPVIIYLAVHHWPSHLDWLYFIIIILLSFLSALFPVNLNGKPVYLTLWITVPAFLLYGLLIEIIAMQVIVWTILFSNRKQKFEASKFLFATLVFFFISLVSAATFHLVGGEIGMMDFWPLVAAVIVYQLTQRIMYILIYSVYYKIRKRLQNSFFRWILIETMIIFLISPFILTLYFLLNFIGVGSFLLLGIPFFFLVSVIRRYTNTKKINQALEQASAIGQRISHNTTENAVIDEFVESVARMFEADFTYLYDYSEDWLEPLRIFENGQFQKLETKQLVLSESITDALLKEKKSFIYTKRNDWADLSEDYSHPGMESMFAIPILRDQEVTGVLAVASKRKNAFEKYQLQIADILCSYFTVSVIRTRSVERTIKQSERCGLTSLYNYNYLEERLMFEFNRFKQGNIDALTVLMLDIDYFKNVNDTYGHESGNEILIELAKLLESRTPQNGIVGRYGGEEFVYILPNFSKEEGMQFGELVRKMIEAYQFTVTQDLGRLGKAIDVSITVSIGVSTIPEDTDELNSLVRNADRALYLGAKRAGRNRVASYIK